MALQEATLPVSSETFSLMKNKDTSAAPYCTGLKTEWTSMTMETTTQFPVDTGTVVEVTCSNSEYVKKGSSELTCKTGKIFTFSVEPSCSIPGLKLLISDEWANENYEGIFFVPGIELLHFFNFGVRKKWGSFQNFPKIPKFCYIDMSRKEC